MHEIVLAGNSASAFASWRSSARTLLQQHAEPGSLCWRVQSDTQTNLLVGGNLFDTAAAPGNARESATRETDTVGTADNARVPREFIRLAESVACHSSLLRWDALYRVLFRLTHGEASLLDVATDPDVHQLTTMDKAVRRDVHKMHAFVRFKAVENVGHEMQQRIERTAPTTSEHATNYIAWFEPQHHVVQRATPFFARRFVSMHWSILTPTECAHWNGVELQFTPGVSRALAPKEDELEELWRSYYAHIFNPARVSIRTMQAEMPQRYWNNLPEAGLIAGLTRDAPARVFRMLRQLDEAPAPLPDDLQSRVGDALLPERARASANGDNSFGARHAQSRGAQSRGAQSRGAQSRGAQSRGAQSRDSQSSGSQSLGSQALNAPGTSDPVHDPGVAAASLRAASAWKDGPANSASAAVFKVADIDVRIGTASWTDPTLLQRGVFYPDNVTTAESRLNYYAQHFSLVEVDSTYYVPPTRAMAAAWAARTPESFVFDIKGFALMTGHAAETKRLPDWLRRALPRSVIAMERFYAKDLSTKIVDDVWARFQHALSPLRDAGKLGPILLQFPRWFTPSRESADALRTARERLGDSSAAVEFRNPDWVTGRMANRTVKLLESLNLTYVVVDAPPGTGSSMPPFAPITTPELSVVRLHGRRIETWEAKNAVVSERYRYLYDSQQLNDWGARIGGIAHQLNERRIEFPDMAKAKQGVHVVFNNCHANYGTTNAIEITQTLIEFDKMRRMLARAPDRRF